MDAKTLMEQHAKETRTKALYQIKDVKVGFVGSPFEQANTNSALRAFAELVNRDQNLYAHAEDYQFFFIGTQNEQTGDIISTPMFLENAVNVKMKKEEK